MDGREGMTSFYLNRGISGSGSHAVSGSQTGLHHVPPPGFKTQPNPNISPHHANLRVASSVPSGAFQIENHPSHNFPHGGINMGGGGVGGGSSSVSNATQPGSGGETVKKKRGRPRKYAPDGSHVSLGLSPVSLGATSGPITPIPKKNRGRPPGSGRKQRLAALGEWMNSSAGLAFTPHIIHISVGEDIAGKILSFAQQRPRALCILSANGAASAVTLRQPTNSGGTVTYEGRFEILCLSGSYLVSETGGPRNRTGGISISVCTPDGHVLGGAIGGRLIAASLVQVVVCSFVYGSAGTKAKVKPEPNPKDESYAIHLDNKAASIPTSGGSSQNLPSPLVISWPQDSRSDMRNSHTEIDLTRG